MIPASPIVILTGALLGVVALAGFAWAWRRGQFEHLDEQARVIFDERDYRLERAWESDAQREERERAHGALVPPRPGEWGGAE